MLSNGGFVVTWTNVEFGFQGFDEFRTLAQRFTATGQRAGAEFAVGPQDEVGGPIAIIALPAGGFIILYQTGNVIFPTAIRGQRFSNSGARVDSPFVVQAAQSAAALPNGFVVAYSTYPNGIYAQRYTNGGRPFGGVIPVSAGGLGVTDVAGLSDGGFVVVWEWSGQDGSGKGIYGQRYDVNAAPVGSRFRVNPYTAGDQVNPSVAALSNGGFAVTWDSMGQDGSFEGVYAQRFSASGARLGGGFRVNTFTPASQDIPCIAGLPDGGFVIMWMSDGQDGSGLGVYGKRYNSAGMPASKEFRVNTFTQDHQRWPSVAAFNNGGFVAVWESSGQDGIFGQRFLPD